MPESDDLRQFFRDIAARHERIWREQAQMLREQTEMLRALREETTEAHRAQAVDNRSHRQALLHVLDRLENGGSTA